LSATADAVALLALHYGPRNSGFYRNPVDDFVGYVAVAPRRVGVLLGSAWFGLDATYWASASSRALAVLAVAMTFAFGALLRHLQLRLDGSERMSAAWMAVGSLLALCPVVVAEPSARLLGVAMVGVSGVIALVLDAPRRPYRTESTRMDTLTGAVMLAVAISHFVLGPIDTLRAFDEQAAKVGVIDQRLSWLREHIERGKSTVLVVRAVTPSMTYWTPFMLRDGAPARWRVLSFQSGPLYAFRAGPRTLELTGKERPLFSAGPDDLFRKSGELREGDVLDAPGLRATILELDGRQLVRRARFEFDQDMDESSVLCIAEGRSGFEEVSPPPTGTGAWLD
jgi:hypothetical protein